MGWLSTAVQGLASVCNIAGAVGVPFAGMVGTVLDQGLNLCNLATGGGGGGGSGAGRSGGAYQNYSNLTQTTVNLGKMEENQNEIWKEVGAVKEILTTGFSKMCDQFEVMKSDLDKIQTLASKTFEMIQEMHYLDGIENIDFAHAVFFKPNSNIEENIASFKSHQFELEKQYMQHLNPRKIIRFLHMLAESEEGGAEKAEAMYNYVLTVEAKYLQMMCICHIHKQDTKGLAAQYELFTAHYHQLTDAMGPIREQPVKKKQQGKCILSLA